VHAVWLLAVLKLALRLELGPEYDTNANRAEVVSGAANVDQPTASFLVRTTARGALAWQSGRNLLRLSGGLGGKVFFNPDVQDQDVLVGQLTLDERVRAAPWLDVGVGADYYDAGQLDVLPPCWPLCPKRHRDFRTGSTALRIAFLDGPGDLTLLGGYRGFVYKPDEDFDFDAAFAQVQANARLRTGPADRETEWTLSAGYQIEKRWFSVGETYARTCYPGPPIKLECLARAGAREDRWQEAQVELSYLRAVLISTGYAVQLNQSSSFGQSLLRHIFTAKLGFRLPWQIYTTLKAQLLVTTYLDPVLLNQTINSQTFVSIDEENRNALLVDLERPVGRTGLAVVARYSLYTNELSSSAVSFLRQVIYLGVTYKIATTR
jgi:hypothetical protein